MNWMLKYIDISTPFLYTWNKTHLICTILLHDEHFHMCCMQLSSMEWFVFVCPTKVTHAQTFYVCNCFEQRKEPKQTDTLEKHMDRVSQSHESTHFHHICSVKEMKRKQCYLYSYERICVRSARFRHEKTFPIVHYSCSSDNWLRLINVYTLLDRASANFYKTSDDCWMFSTVKSPNIENPIITRKDPWELEIHFKKRLVWICWNGQHTWWVGIEDWINIRNLNIWLFADKLECIHSCNPSSNLKRILHTKIYRYIKSVETLKLNMSSSDLGNSIPNNSGTFTNERTINFWAATYL